MKTIEELAREAGCPNRRNIWPPTFTKTFDFSAAQLTRFAALVRAQALEEAAALCEKATPSEFEAVTYVTAGVTRPFANGMARAIRALAKEPSRS